MIKYTKKERALIWLSHSLRTNLRKRVSIYENYDLEDLFENFSAYSFELEKVLGKDYANLSSNRTDEYVDNIIERNDELGVRFITIESDYYPEELKNIHNPPLVLTCKGDIELLKMQKIAVVGPREPTQYAINVTQDFVKAFVTSGLCVVSGIARGIDVTAHKTCLANNGKTIAVLPCGIDVVYPQENIDAYRKAAENGLLLTEYCLGSRVQKYTFNERNRIISGLSNGVFVPEMGEKSGSKLTVEFALEHNRAVYSVPGSIYSKNSLGSNKLLRDLQGAIVLNPQDVLNDFDLVAGKSEKQTQLTYEQSLIVNALEKGELHYEELIAKTGLSAKTLTTELLSLEISGFIVSLPGNCYEIKSME